MEDAQIIALYEEWSEQAYAAGFLVPDETSVSQFRQWLKQRKSEEGIFILNEREETMLEEFKRQEAADAS